MKYVQGYTQKGMKGENEGGGGGWRGGTEFSLVPIFAMCSKENLRAFFF